MMMMCGMQWMFFWLFLGTLLFIALIAAVIWLLARAFRSQRLPVAPLWQQTPSGPKPHPHQYQQRSSDPVPGSETYEEGERAYHYPEQPSAIYPQAQQEQRPRF